VAVTEREPAGGDAAVRRIADEAVALCALAGVGVVAPLVQRPEPVLAGVFRVDVAAGAAVGAVTAAMAALERARSGRRPVAEVDGRWAQIAFRSERYLRRDGRVVGELWAPLSGDYATADGWVKVHANFPHHAAAAAAALGVAAEREALAATLRRSTALDAEARIMAAGGVAGALRSRAAWAAHPQGAVDGATPVLRLAPTGPAVAPRSWSAGEEPAPSGTARPAASGPLAGVRVLDLTRVIAGPVCGRVLAAHGADVLTVGAAHLPQIEALVLDTGFGKRSTWLDLRRDADRSVFEGLVAGADVLVQSYRPGALAALGYDPAQLAACSPGLVIVDVSAYSRGGPWAARRGFDSLVQLVSGIAHEAMVAAGADAPVPLPCQALDHATGWLAALAAVAGLLRQRREGGSWRAEVSLAATAAWLDGLGRHGPGPAWADPAGPDGADVADLLVETPSAGGLLRHVRMPGTLDGRAATWRCPPPQPGSSPPAWSTGPPA